MLIVLAVFSTGCKKEDELLIKESLKGYVQKGPYINGSAITVAELHENLNPTGKVFSTQIVNNQGSFELNDLALNSKFVELRADGFYFDEILGEKSTAQLTLFAIADVTDQNSINVNVLTQLEKGRVEYLLGQGFSFAEAKKQAQGEVFSIFNFDISGMRGSEVLDISQDGEDNAALLAASLILQGYRSVGDMTELIANISTDIKEDGVLNSSSLGMALMNHARLLNMLEIRENLENRYEELGVNATIPDFEKYVQLFQDSSDFEFTSSIEYPEYSEYGENILFDSKSDIKTNYDYSLAANLPIGAKLEIILKGGMWYYQVLPNGPVNWKVSQYNETERSQLFTAIESGKKCDLKIEFETLFLNGNDTIISPPGVKDSIIIEYYENVTEIPTKTKVIYLE